MQAELLTPDDDEGKEEEYYVSSTPVFQEVLFKFLDTEAPTLTGPAQSSKQKQEVNIFICTSLNNTIKLDLSFKYLQDFVVDYAVQQNY